MSVLSLKECLIKESDFIYFANIGKCHGVKGGFFLLTVDRKPLLDEYKRVFLKKKLFAESFISNICFDFYFGFGSIRNTTG